MINLVITRAFAGFSGNLGFGEACRQVTVNSSKQIPLLVSAGIALAGYGQVQVFGKTMPYMPAFGQAGSSLEDDLGMVGALGQSSEGAGNPVILLQKDGVDGHGR